MKKLMTFITLSAIAISNYAQANEQPHQAHMNMQMSTGSAMQQELMQGMDQMNQDMMAAAQYKDPEMRKLAENIINAQQAEIEQMQKWLKAHNKKK